MSDQTQLPRLQLLHSLMGKLAAKDTGFAHSLMDGFRKYGKLSAKQIEWVEILITRATAPPKAVRETEHSQHIPGFQCVEDLLYKAQVAFPCIRLQTQKGQRIQLRPKKNKRAVKVKVESYSGDVSNEVLDTSYLRYLPDLTDVLNTLHEVASDSVRAAILYGKKTKCCCFCGISLTDPRSRYVGYGPICAENYGLPWGENEGALEMAKIEEMKEQLAELWAKNNT